MRDRRLFPQQRLRLLLCSRDTFPELGVGSPAVLPVVALCWLCYGAEHSVLPVTRGGRRHIRTRAGCLASSSSAPAQPGSLECHLCAVPGSRAFAEDWCSSALLLAALRHAVFCQATGRGERRERCPRRRFPRREIPLSFTMPKRRSVPFTF